jgi:hypothetical protein
MELDDFKLTWKAAQAASAVQHDSLLELQTRLRQKSRSVTVAIRRNLWVEIIMYLVFVALALVGWELFTTSYLRVVCMLTWMLSIIFLLYLFQLLRSIRRYESGQGSMKEAMKQLVLILEKFMQTYFQLTMVTLFVAFSVGLLGGITTVNENGIAGQFHWKKAGLIYVACFVVWSVCMYFFARWYLRKMYGAHILQLKQQLTEIENG